MALGMFCVWSFFCRVLLTHSFPTPELTVAPDSRLPPSQTISSIHTGNDLSRVLGWGAAYQDQKFRRVLDKLFLGVPVLLDRWQVSIGGMPSLCPAPLPLMCQLGVRPKG